MATHKAKITKTIVDKLTPGDTVWDTELAGFGVYVIRESWVFKSLE